MKGLSRKRKAGKRSPTRSAAPSRAQVNRILHTVMEQAALLDRLRAEQDIQFRRMAQLQAELDSLKQLLDKRPALP